MCFFVCSYASVIENLSFFAVVMTPNMHVDFSQLHARKPTHSYCEIKYGVIQGS